MRLRDRNGFLVGLFALLFAALAGCGLMHQGNPAPMAELHFTIPNTRGATEDLVLDRFLRDGDALEQKSLPKRRGSPNGSLRSGTSANYYGFGERFDRLDHVHSILKNETRNIVEVKGSDTYKPVPFFMNLRGYGVWVDTYSDAVFDLNVSDATHIRIRARGKKLRVLLFEGPRFPTILDRFTALAGRQQLPPYWAFAPWKARDYHRNQQEVYEHDYRPARARHP
jgi:alpha-glucosidase (family GH31 glycosyl hydrolase)